MHHDSRVTRRAEVPLQETMAACAANHGFFETRPFRMPAWSNGRTTRLGFRVTNHETRDTNHGFFESPPCFLACDFPRFPTISRHFPRFPGPPRGPQIECQRTVIRSRSASEKNSAENALAHPAGLAGCFESFGSLARAPGQSLLACGIEMKERCGKIPSLHFSPRGDAKWVRGPSGLGASRAEEKGASRLARAGLLEQYVEHGKQVSRRKSEVLAVVSRASAGSW